MRVEYSGAGPPPGPLARAATLMGWLSLFTLVIMLAVFLHRKYNKLSTSTSSFYSNHHDLTALRTRLEAQFRFVSAQEIIILNKIHSGFATFKNTEEGLVELGGLDLTGDVPDTADGEMKKSEELLGS